MSITTKKGDQGKSHFLGKIVDKNSPLLEAIGAIDELMAILQLASFENKIIDDLVEIMGFLVCGSKIDLNQKVEFLEKEIENSSKKKGDLKKTGGFIKFKNKKAMELNWARTVARRAERELVSLNIEEKIDENVLKYFNRLSDYLFIKALEN